MAPESKRYVTQAVVKVRVLFGVILLLMGLWLLVTWNNHGTTVLGDRLLLIAVACCVAGVVDLLGAMREGIWIDANGMTVRGIVRNRRLVWGEIVSFDMNGSAGFANNCLRIHLRSGEALKVKSVVQPRLGADNTSIVQALNAGLAGASTPDRPDAR